MRPSSLLLPVLPFASLSSAWGLLGHRTVAILSTRFLLPQTATWVRSLLGDENIALASTWADDFAHKPEGRYSAPWHYIDSKDNPPKKCGVSYSRDCPLDHGCIVSAIINQTSRVSSKTLPKAERSRALKFLIHFLGDIHQPLHTEDLKRGGNEIGVVFGGRKVNLHHVWDTSIPEKHIGGNSVRFATRWADALHQQILTGKFSNPKLRANWSSCVNPTTSEKCSLSWATVSNGWVCDYVLPPNYPVGFAGSELSGKYYQAAVPIVDELVAMAGFKLAGYLNMIVTKKSGLSAAEIEELVLSGFNAQDVLAELRDEEVGIGARVVKKVIAQVEGWWGRVRSGEL